MTAIRLDVRQPLLAHDVLDETYPTIPSALNSRSQATKMAADMERAKRATDGWENPSSQNRENARTKPMSGKRTGDLCTFGFTYARRHLVRAVAGGNRSQIAKYATGIALSGVAVGLATATVLPMAVWLSHFEYKPERAFRSRSTQGTQEDMFARAAASIKDKFKEYKKRRDLQTFNDFGVLTQAEALEICFQGREALYVLEQERQNHGDSRLKSSALVTKKIEAAWKEIERFEKRAKAYLKL